LDRSLGGCRVVRHGAGGLVERQPSRQLVPEDQAGEEALLVDDQRQLPDDQIKAVVARGAVIGASCDAWMIVPNWVRGVSTPQSAGCTFERLADHVLHICSLAGSTRHVCIGSDLDGLDGLDRAVLLRQQLVVIPLVHLRLHPSVPLPYLLYR